MGVRVLIADSSAITRDVIRRHLECGGCQVVAETETVAQATTLFRTTRPDVVTIDLGLRGSDGADALGLFRSIRAEAPSTVVVIVGASRVPEARRMLLREGALDCVIEPFDTFGFEQMWRKLSAAYPELRRHETPPPRRAARARPRALRA